MRWRDVPGVWVAIALLGLLSGCGSDGDGAPAAAGAGGEGGAGGAAGGAGGAGGSAVACTRQGELDLSGTWLIKARLDVVMKSVQEAPVQVCPEDQTGPAELLLVARFEQSGVELTSVGVTICDFTLPGVTAIVGACAADTLGSVKSQVVPTEGLRAELPGLVVPKGKGKLGGTADGASFEPERLTFVLGSQSLKGPMAAWKGGPICDDPKAPLGTGEGCEEQCVTSCGDVIDSDEDKLPGVSMAVCGRTPDELQGTKCNTEHPEEPGVTLQGTAAINFRVNPLLKGKAESSCLVRGNVDAEIDYNVLGANVRLAGGILSVKQVRDAIPVFDVLPETSQFVAVRVDGQYGSPKLEIAADNPKAACKMAIDNQNIF